MEFKEKILSLRQRYSMSQNDLAEAIGVSRKSIQFYEAGERYPKKAILEKISEVFNVSMDYLVSSEELFVIEASDAGGRRGRISAEQLVENAAALFAGGEMSDDDKDKIMKAIQDAYWEAKDINKKYTPKKYLNEKK